jgi:hypothetical protein
MRTILSNFYRDAGRRALARALADCDDRQLLDLGLVRAADGTLWLASDPTQPAGPEPAEARRTGLFGGIWEVFGWLRGLPLRSQDWHPHFFLRE